MVLIKKPRRFKAVKMKSGKGFIVKRKAKKIHTCKICFKDIEINGEYYQLNYYGSNYKSCICENCWKGIKLYADNKREYDESYQALAWDGGAYE